MRVLLCVFALSLLTACGGSQQRSLVTDNIVGPNFAFSYDQPDNQLAQAYAVQHCANLGMRAYMTGTQAFYGADDRVSTFSCR